MTFYKYMIQHNSLKVSHSVPDWLHHQYQHSANYVTH